MFRTTRLLQAIGFILICSSCGTSNVVSALEITRGPYLQLNTPSSIVVRWRTDQETTTVVRYGTSPTQLNQTKTVSGSRTEHEVALTNLNAASEYYYSVGNSNTTLAGGNSDYRFITSPQPGSELPTRIWLIGDSGTANSNAAAVYNAYLNYSGSDNTHLWLMLGDNAYNSGTDSEYQAAVFNMYPELLRRTPVWSTLGNHDGYTADSASESGPYYDIFTLPRNAEAGGLASGTEAYYSFDYGNIHFVCLDSYETNRDVNGAMLTWLENDLAANDKKWTIAFWHHPPYTKGSHNSDSESRLIDMRENAVPLLESYGVDMIFTGHSHSYERSFLIDGHYGSSSSFNNTQHLVDGGDGREDGNGAYQKSVGSTRSGAVYTVAGASGKLSGGSLNHPAMFTSLNQLGSVVLDVTGNRIEAKYLRSDGVVTDYYTLIKGEDTSGPHISSAQATGYSQVVVNFNETLAVASASDASNYSLKDGNNQPIAVNSVYVNDHTVTLTTDTLVLGASYTLTINNVEDDAGNAIAPNSTAHFTFQNNVTVELQQGTAGYAGMQDTYIASGAGSTNFGGEQALLADGYDGSNGELVTLLKWDVSLIPSNATVNQVDVVLDIFNPTPGSYNVYAGDTTWSESTATWNSVDPHNNRGAVVGSVSPSSTGSYIIELNSSGQALVQTWVNGGTNNGLFVMTSGTNDGIDIRSSEYANTASRPSLIVDYSDSSGSSNQAPTANFDWSANHLSVTFSDQSTDPDDGIAQWLWQFGDGNTSTAANPVHTYASSGDYSVLLTVTDHSGVENSLSQTVTASHAQSATTVHFQQGLNGYSGAQDTYVASGSNGSNYGTSTAILSDGDDGSRDELISLLQWDVSSIPAGATVVSATITLEVFNKTNSEYNIWGMTQNWQETTATWANTQPSTQRGDEVGNLTPTSTGSYTINLNASGVALVQSWVSGGNNYGVTIQSGGTRNGIDIRSKEYGSVSVRPTLSVTYEQP